MEHRALAQALRQHSFVVWKTKGEDASTITRAFACMHRFFEENTPQHKQACASVVQGRSFGYAATRAKESFTVYGTANSTASVDPSVQYDGLSIPVDVDGVKDCLHALYELMHDTALKACQVLRLMLESVGRDFSVEYARLGDATEVPSDGCSASVVDVFHYYNSPELVNNVNCAEHTDPGILSVATRADVPGLQLLDAETEEWEDIETIVESTDLVVFVGQVGQWLTGDAYPAAIHRVRKYTQPRLNFVFELRPHRDPFTGVFLLPE